MKNIVNTTYNSKVATCISLTKGEQFTRAGNNLQEQAFKFSPFHHADQVITGYV